MRTNAAIPVVQLMTISIPVLYAGSQTKGRLLEPTETRDLCIIHWLFQKFKKYVPL